MSLAPKYNFKEVEEGLYEFWVKEGFFVPGKYLNEKDLKKAKPYTIVIPPPNITGRLHIGHSWDGTVQDIIIRRKRMQGFKTLFLPGTDHAGVATQAKLDQELKKNGQNRYEIGRDEFLKFAFSWVSLYQNIIHSQWKAMGLSLDYTKERFTMDEDYSKSVIKAFVTLYNKGLIYRDYKIINYDCMAKTALSNIEVEHRETMSFLYYIRYYFVDDSSNYLVVATTRPETMFGDQALMVNPKDSRYSKYVGREVYIPNTLTKIKVISDSYVDMEFGTGVVKVTPAHDVNDYEVSKRHNLKPLLCMEENGTMSSICGKYSGLDRFETRDLLVKDLEKSLHLEEIKDYKNVIGYSERTGVMIEPRLSLQWFLKMDIPGKNAMNTSVKFIPLRFKKIYKNWLSDVQDWCISRQVWWGHRIPVYYKGDEIICSETSPGESYTQDEDVLDTWFSSSLWPIATLGWPNTNRDLFKEFFPTTSLITGYDLVFFWVSRMIFQSIEFTGKDPFKNVVFHGLIRDKNGTKMSKSLGNGVDPLDVIDTYGVDSLRLFLTSNSAPGFDLRFDTEKLEASWNFINKLYNIGRFISLNIDTKEDNYLLTDNIFDNYILSNLNECISKADKFYERFEFNECYKILSNFIWDILASNYLEYTKFAFNDPSRSLNTKKILLYVYKTILKLLHPFIPFVTEKLYLEVSNDKSITISKWPKVKKTLFGSLYADEVFDLISKVRNYKNVNNIIPSKHINGTLVCSDPSLYEYLVKEKEIIGSFLLIDEFFVQNSLLSSSDILILSNKLNFYLKKDGLVDTKQILNKLLIQKDNLLKEIKRSESILNNKNFLEKASKEKILEEEEKRINYQNSYSLVLNKIKEYEQ
ncbi:MAG: valine--tRNA ligase [Acholeplasmatales bacterium]|jgi:valyl-tRNA synthetase|nr:valine--tRNA ligase [Acholeplasmatales bacterium]